MNWKKIGEKLLGAGMGAVLLFGSGLDCPENNMILIYGGIIAGLVFMIAGAKMADVWR